MYYTANINLPVPLSNHGMEMVNNVVYTIGGYSNQSGDHRYLYHQGNEQTTGGALRAAARPWLIQICPSRYTI